MRRARTCAGGVDDLTAVITGGEKKTEINLTERFHWLQAPGTQEIGCSISCGSFSKQGKCKERAAVVRVNMGRLMAI